MNEGQMELSYEEIQMELDLRGSEVYMADSQGIKVTGPMVLTALGVEPGSDATMLDSRQIVVTGVPVQGALAGTRVMETLGINVEVENGTQPHCIGYSLNSAICSILNIATRDVPYYNHAAGSTAPMIIGEIPPFIFIFALEGGDWQSAIADNRHLDWVLGY